MKAHLVFFWLFLLSGCGSPVVRYLNERADFSSFESYQLVNVKINKRQLSAQTTELLGILEGRVRYHMEDLRNYQPTELAPDLVLRYELVSATSTPTNVNPGTPFTPPTLNTQVLYESVVLLELYHQKKLVWQGSYDLKQHRKAAKNERVIKDAVDRIFTSYPYRARSGSADPSLTATTNDT